MMIKTLKNRKSPADLMTPKLLWYGKEATFNQLGQIGDKHSIEKRISVPLRHGFLYPIRGVILERQNKAFVLP